MSRDFTEYSPLSEDTTGMATQSGGDQTPEEEPPTKAYQPEHSGFKSLNGCRIVHDLESGYGSGPDSGSRLGPSRTHQHSLASGSSRRSSHTNFLDFTSKYFYPMMGGSSSRKKREEEEIKLFGYKIEYSVFQMGPVGYMDALLGPEPIHNGEIGGDDLVDAAILFDKVHYDELVADVKESILIHPPKLISQGSSGCYAIYNSKGRVVGVFKPKDEEPYGPLSPKWSKWLHRTFFPCLFGRSCLIPNLGYVSEAAVSVLDHQLGSQLVPRTEIVELSSESFYYGYLDRGSCPPKAGSLQLFLHDFTEASKFLARFPVPELTSMPGNHVVEVPIKAKDETIGNGVQNDDVDVDVEVEVDLPTEEDFVWNLKTLTHFREELEKLVILDYIVRNTDRGLDNWMVKVNWICVSESGGKRQFEPRIKIGAIDSGLSFPWKHPDEWRSFPYGWLFLPLSVIGHPFSQKTRRHYLKLLTSTSWWEETVVNLTKVFVKDREFSLRMWKKQIAVIKGQAFNVVEVLKFGHLGPLELTRREHVLVLDRPVTMVENGEQESPYNDRTPLLGSMEDSAHISGFDYNVNYTSVNTSTKVVYMERLVLHRKSPIFTWC